MAKLSDPIQFMRENRARKLDDIEILERGHCRIAENFNGSTSDTTKAESNRLGRQVARIETILTASDEPFDE